jgi:ABC-type transport system involved in Fe-S cluster assembly fused permease/ATPase subunit
MFNQNGMGSNFHRNDSLTSYEAVKYFNAESFEFARYRKSLMDWQKWDYKVQMSLNVMNICQNIIFMFGLLMVCFISAYQVTIGQIMVGQFVSMLTYMAQLQTPLNYFGTFYRVIQSSMINAERLLELFKEKPTVVDLASAQPLLACRGDIRLKDVVFTYDKKKSALSSLNIHCKPGTMTAFVGESGGGKSTIFRLLFRFYNPDSGCIEIDGHDVQDITIDSLRQHIGVVPQETVLFNDTLMFNLKYANQDATDEDVYEACRAASIHDRIVSFTHGYQTKVGERGMRLSGGEKQRIAIARTILKSPRIILLDEATAALDTTTEQHIQSAFKSLAQGRTMLVIAHRLSTITMADQIVVIQEGRVVEKGTHDDLRGVAGGAYANMWSKQAQAQRLASEARMLSREVHRLRRESKGATVMEAVEPRSSDTSEGEEDFGKKPRIHKHDSDGRSDHKSDDEHQAQHEALQMRQSG